MNHVPKLRCKLQFDQSKYAHLCTELKHLYVAVTRAKKRLIIYDDSQDARFHMQEFWEMMNVVSRVEISEIENTVSENSEVIRLAQKSSQDAWRNQGLRMMSHKFYDQAIKCFHASKDKDLELNALAHSKANEATEILSNSQYESGYYITKQMKTRLKSDKKRARIMFKETADIFYELASSESKFKSVLLRKAARCYASACEYEKAAHIFESENQIGQAAEAYLASGNIEKAGDLFNEKQEYVRAIECFSRSHSWEKLIKCIHQNRSIMTVEQRQKYIYKYVPAALEDLMPKLLPSAEGDTAYIKKVIEEDKNKILEVNESDEDSEESNREEIQEKEVIKEALSEEEHEIESEEETKEVMSSHNPFLNRSQSSDSFVLLDNKSASDNYSFISGSNLDEEIESGFEIGEGLEDIDPEDEWLQIDNRSVVESLHSAIKKDGSLMSDYSIIDNIHAAALNLGGKLINTRAEIFIEDETMRKMIEIIGMFSDEVHTHLKTLKSAESLISSQMIKEDWELVSLIDLDDISQEFLGVILDTLEDFGMFKMCLVVCNRYRLADRLGRYVNSLAFKYSNISSVKIDDIEKPNFHLGQTQRAVIAYTAVHNVFEMMNPEYLSLKEKFDTKNLGIESLQGLLLLGYWKKTVYIVDKETALAITSTFADFKNFRNIYSIFSETSINKQNPFIIENPISDSEIEAAIIDLDCVNWNLNAFYSYTIQKKYNFSDNGDVCEFPDYFTYNNAYWNFTVNKDEKCLDGIKKCFRKIKSIFDVNSKRDERFELVLWDALSCFSQIFYSANNPRLQNALESFSYDDFQALLQSLSIITKILSSVATTLSADPYYSSILFSLLSPFGIRKIIYSKITQVLPYSTHAIVHKSSNLLKFINIQTIKDAYIADIETQYLLIPIKDLKTALNQVYIQALANILKKRSKMFMLLQAASAENPCLNNDKESIRVLADIYGELWMYDFIQAQMHGGNPYSLSYVNYDALGNKRYSDYIAAKKRLEDIFEMADGYEYSVYFIQINKNAEIRALKKTIIRYERYLSEIYGFGKADILRFIIDKCRYIIEDFPVITDIAKHALLTYIQTTINMSTSVITDDEVVKSLYIAYELSKLTGYTVYYQEMLNSRCKSTLKNDVKMPKNSEYHRFALLYLDIDVYFKFGFYEDVAKSIFSLFEGHIIQLDIIIRMFFFEKAISS